MLATATLVTRVLPPAEWPRLAGTEADLVWRLLDPERAAVVVVEREDVIMGCWVTFPVQHVECLWVAPEARTTASVPRRLWLGMHAYLRSIGCARVMTAAIDDHVRTLLTKVGATPVPGQSFVMEVR